jgi:hypothetical protein
MFLMFCFVAALGTTSVYVLTQGGGLTGAATAYVQYTECVDYGNYIIFSNDAGWKKVKKDLCTGKANRFLLRVACVKNEWGWYEAEYAEIAYCASGADCSYDTNDAAFCPGDGVVAEIARQE